MNETLWLSIARSELGTAEIPGKQHSPKIQRWLTDLKAWWKDDETPWCGTFVAHCVREAGLPLPANWFRAKAWLEWGRPTVLPAVGCVVVYAREGGGHVGFVVGYDQNGRLLTLGGNQGNRVSIMPFDRSRVIGYRWPAGIDIPTDPLPILSSTGGVSTQEA